MIAVVDTTPRRNMPAYGPETVEGHDYLHGWLFALCQAQIAADEQCDFGGYFFFLEWYKAVSE